jgi:hypothetical protein
MDVLPEQGGYAKHGGRDEENEGLAKPLAAFPGRVGGPGFRRACGGPTGEPMRESPVRPADHLRPEDKRYVDADRGESV